MIFKVRGSQNRPEIVSGRALGPRGAPRCSPRAAKRGGGAQKGAESGAKVAQMGFQTGAKWQR